MNAEDGTQEIAFGAPKDAGGPRPDPDLGPWGTEAVPLGKGPRSPASPGGGTPPTSTKPHRWIAGVAIVCALSLIAVLGALVIDGESGHQAERTNAAQTRGQQPAAEWETNGDRTRRAEQGRRRARVRSRRRSFPSPPTTHPTPSPTYAPDSEPAPALEPVVPSPAPAPALGPSPTTKPPPASGPTVAKEFGFER